MKTELELRRELREVRKRLAAGRRQGLEDDDLLYGAQQTLCWALGLPCRSPCEVVDLVIEVAEQVDLR